MSSRPNGSAAYWVRLNISAPERASAHVSVLVFLARSASANTAVAARGTERGTRTATPRTRFGVGHHRDLVGIDPVETAVIHAVVLTRRTTPLQRSHRQRIAIRGRIPLKLANMQHHKPPVMVEGLIDPPDPPIGRPLACPTPSPTSSDCPKQDGSNSQTTHSMKAQSARQTSDGRGGRSRAIGRLADRGQATGSTAATTPPGTRSELWPVQRSGRRLTGQVPVWFGGLSSTATLPTWGNH